MRKIAGYKKDVQFVLQEIERDYAVYMANPKTRKRTSTLGKISPFDPYIEKMTKEIAQLFADAMQPEQLAEYADEMFNELWIECLLCVDMVQNNMRFWISEQRDPVKYAELSEVFFTECLRSAKNYDGYVNLARKTVHKW